ncbi:BQ2448_1484 [Microbotryum intermedium]|uniref:BQ2448_1484 protein n=1 Tax=Microbotryum intermedium TaxID=269621 RepID=A0A238F8B4_9BASI|nr:BQ2448_1484 [Microbotryum intermedium]
MSIKRIISTTSSSTNPNPDASTTASSSSSHLSAFTSCTSYVQALPNTLDNSTKLHLYALYKIAISSPYPSTPRPGIWDFTSRAKWDAWNELGRKDVAFSMGGEESRTNAREAYLEQGTRLGWRPETGVQELEWEGLQVPEGEGVQSLASASASGGSSSQRREGSGAGSGMVKVSTMLSQEDLKNKDIPKSPLHELALDGDASKLEVYLKERSKENLNVDEFDSYGFTPIHLATDRGHLNLVKILLQYGANKHLRDQDGNTPLQLAEIAGHDELLVLLQE